MAYLLQTPDQIKRGLEDIVRTAVKDKVTCTLPIFHFITYIPYCYFKIVTHK